MSKPIVVGVDGSSNAIAAARYAAAMAEAHDAPLRLVHVTETFHGYGPIELTIDYAETEKRLREWAEHMLADSVNELETAHPGLKVDYKMTAGVAAARLIDESEQALMTVVGSRGAGGFASLMLGSVSAQVAAHAHSPVIVVRPVAAPDGPILVGYDGSEGANAALEFAVREALTRKVPLVVATAYWEEAWGWHARPAIDPVITARHKAEQMIADALELPLEEHPELQYEIRTIHSLNPEHSLVEESAQARLTVVGCRGRGGFAGLLMGSVSRTLVQHAAGPVAVIHPVEP